jgi:hypothetical protein
VPQFRERTRFAVTRSLIWRRLAQLILAHSRPDEEIECTPQSSPQEGPLVEQRRLSVWDRKGMDSLESASARFLQGGRRSRWFAATERNFEPLLQARRGCVGNGGEL